MSDQGYLSDKREAQIAKILDASIDFNKVLNNQKKVLGIFALGTFMERNDRKVFKFMISILDDKLIGKNPDMEVLATIETVLSLLENKDIAGFLDYVSGLMADRIKTPFDGFDKQIFLSVLMMLSGLIGKAIELIEAKLIEAELEQ